MSSPPSGVLITEPAAELLRQLQARHGPVLFHQSGGCCDGSAPMCFPLGEFLVGDRDVLLGILDIDPARPQGVPVWISGPQFEAWKHTQLIVDLVPGRGSGFSLEAPEGYRFLSRARVFTESEQQLLAQDLPITGVDFQRGRRPVVRGTAVDLATVAGACRVAATGDH